MRPDIIFTGIARSSSGTLTSSCELIE